MPAGAVAFGYGARIFLVCSLLGLPQGAPLENVDAETVAVAFIRLFALESGACPVSRLRQTVGNHENF